MPLLVSLHQKSLLRAFGHKTDSGKEECEITDFVKFELDTLYPPNADGRRTQTKFIGLMTDSGKAAYKIKDYQ